MRWFFFCRVRFGLRRCWSGAQRGRGRKRFVDKMLDQIRCQLRCDALHDREAREQEDIRGLLSLLVHVVLIWDRHV